MKSNHEAAKNQQPDMGFEGMKSIFDGMQGTLFGLQIEPEEAEAAPEPKPKKTRQPSAKLAKAGAEIAARPEEVERAFLSPSLVQCSIPHRDPGKVNGWKRSNGHFTLVLQPALDAKTMEPMGLPFGEMPRLLLLWIVTEAVRTKKPRIKLGSSLNKFLRQIGANPETGGGKRGDAKRIKDQAEKLFKCHISFEYSQGNKSKGMEAFLNMEVVSSGQFWWDFTSPDQGALFESEIILGDNFFKAILSSPVPIDLRVVIALKKSLKQSSFAIDLYTWASYRIFKMEKARQREIRIPLTELKNQFGGEYKRADHFKAAFSEALEKVQEVFPALDYTLDSKALTLRSGIAPTITTEQTAAQKRLAELRPFDEVSQKVQERFKQQFPRFDLQAALTDFYAWREDKNQQSGNTDAHFWAFAKTWVGRNG